MIDNTDTNAFDNITQQIAIDTFEEAIKIEDDTRKAAAKARKALVEYGIKLGKQMKYCPQCGRLVHSKQTNFTK